MSGFFLCFWCSLPSALFRTLHRPPKSQNTPANANANAHTENPTPCEMTNCWIVNEFGRGKIGGMRMTFSHGRCRRDSDIGATSPPAIKISRNGLCVWKLKKERGGKKRKWGEDNEGSGTVGEGRNPQSHTNDHNILVGRIDQL